MKLAIGADHRGLATKSRLIAALTAAGHAVQDVGTDRPESVDYPDFAQKVASAVSQGEADRGILICGSGIGMSIAANKVRGVRAALCYDPALARLSRQHNDANVLCLSGDFVTPEANQAIAMAWLNTEFEGGRHQRRVDKLSQLDGPR